MNTSLQTEFKAFEKAVQESQKRLAELANGVKGWLKKQPDQGAALVGMVQALQRTMETATSLARHGADTFGSVLDEAGEAAPKESTALTAKLDDLKATLELCLDDPEETIEELIDTL